ncbi:cbb3-type cytochrome c oxidase subunit 3 [Stakelama marina]|uniref:Cbb3-type cytochrome c oxidase subunit 3 n=1 Tax=Stakelama marina TaxID=2826939 RepID=A0A8T4IAI1_9SPHN|nr:cbb3-type cytochrome c oxidase subunit 3 [Stakelama marina]MBR0552028.1 cbb3-type cytochrome c oxidase subunit 3 [Stakelama marina]
MSAYDTLRHFADSWALVLMTIAFVVLTGWAFLPGRRERNDRAAHSIFEQEDKIDG